MKEFKVGDRVKIIKEDANYSDNGDEFDQFFKVGCLGTVTDVCYDAYDVKMDGYPTYLYFLEDEIDII